MKGDWRGTALESKCPNRLVESRLNELSILHPYVYICPTTKVYRPPFWLSSFQNRNKQNQVGKASKRSVNRSESEVFELVVSEEEPAERFSGFPGTR
jgi:hypothetical protein